MSGTPIIRRPQSIVRRGMKRVIEDLADLDISQNVLTICAKHEDDWTDEEHDDVQAEIDRFKSA